MWRMRAETVSGEPCFVTVGVRRVEGRVTLHCSSNEAIALTPFQAQRLRGLLGDAMAEALRGERW